MVCWIVIQCNNGHTACARCHKKLTKGLCPSCLLPIGGNRCTAIEKIIDSLRVPCKYAEYGCEKMLQYSMRKRDGHEDMCKFLPYGCPVAGCNHEGPKSSLPDHFSNRHNSELIYYDKSEDVKISFTISTDDVAYDKSRSQYVIVLVSDDVEPEDFQGSDDQDPSEEDGKDLILIHHQFQEKLSRYSFSVTSFGHCISEYRISVISKREPAFRLGPRARRAFKDSHISEGPIHDNQGEEQLLNRAVRHGDCLFVPKVFPPRGENPKLEVEFQLM